MTGDQVKAWIAAGRELAGLVRDLIATERELKERQASKSSANQPGDSQTKKRVRKKA